MRKYAGGTFVKLLIVVAIVAILASIASLSYLKFQSKCTTSEASSNLGAIRTAEESYRAENNTYLACTASPANGGTDATPDAWVDEGGQFAQIGFVPYGDVRYRYEVVAGVSGITSSYIATATADLDDDDVDSVYTVTESLPKPMHSGDDELPSGYQGIALELIGYVALVLAIIVIIALWWVLKKSSYASS